MSCGAKLVIIVDDDQAVRNALKFSLELEGLCVRSHPTAEEALADADLPAAGCLVVDQYMPGLSGMDFLRELGLRGVDVPAILITARASDDLRRRADCAGFCQVLEKPLEDGGLLDAIREALTEPAYVESLTETI